MTTSRIIFLILCAIGLSGTSAAEGQLENTPALISGGVDESGRKFSYLGQEAKNRKLILTASNGFFSNGTFRAEGISKLPKVGDEELIGPNFEYLSWKKKPGTTRWHVLIKNPGTVQFKIHLATDEPDSQIEVNFADQTRTVSTAKSDGENPQNWELNFEVKVPGEYCLSLGSTEATGSNIGRLYRIDAVGPAIDGANLLRVRWRPAAVHGRYSTEQVQKAKLLVFTTRSTEPVSSYSPITTPFGYYGCSFDSDMRSAGGFNFSMWGNSGAAENLETMPHLLGVGSPEGEFSGFGHEGTGVKPRGWVPMPDRPELVVQALRVENGEQYDTYYGYYFDHPSSSWKFYAAGNKWHGGKPRESLTLGSFCEVPGPPQSQRSGDIYREVRRRGWVWDSEKSWLPIENYHGGPKPRDAEIPINKRWYTTKEGEYAMGCGGIRLYEHDPENIKPAQAPEVYPYYLTSGSIKNLFILPLQFGKIEAREIRSDQAIVEFEINSEPKLIDAELFYGTKDSLTFAPRKLHGTEKNSELSKAVNEMGWPNSVEISEVKPGLNRIVIDGLKPKTKYFYRVLVKNEVSRIWSNTTKSFTTL